MYRTFPTMYIVRSTCKIKNYLLLLIMELQRGVSGWNLSNVENDITMDDEILESYQSDVI